MKILDIFGCDFPGCKGFGLHNHHITYEPSVTRRLCRQHHEEITIINSQQARKFRRRLSNQHRWRNWYEWRKGNLKARRTTLALSWIEKWDQESVQLAEPQVAVEQGERTPRKAGSDPLNRKRGSRTKSNRKAGRKAIVGKVKPSKRSPSKRRKPSTRKVGSRTKKR
jgi:hypothetical protein